MTDNTENTRSGYSVSPAFLASEFESVAPEKARFHVLPAPMELSVSYGGGTALGPAAILRASQELDAFDGDGEPGRAGIHTAPTIDCRAPAECALERIAAAVGAALDLGAVPILLGGEHTVTLGAAQALHARSRNVGFVQFDAHADLREAYEGNPLSHASVMRRVHELGFPVVQFGVRSLSREEADFRQRFGITAFDAERIESESAPQASTHSLLPNDFPDHLYITFDVDVFDPSVMPATGTPVPGGLHWYRVLRLLRLVTRGRCMIGCDVVELAPIDGLHMAEFTAATLVYRLMSLAGLE